MGSLQAHLHYKLGKRGRPRGDSSILGYAKRHCAATCRKLLAAWGAESRPANAGSNSKLPKCMQVPAWLGRSTMACLTTIDAWSLQMHQCDSSTSENGTVLNALKRSHGAACPCRRIRSRNVRAQHTSQRLLSSMGLSV